MKFNLFRSVLPGIVLFLLLDEAPLVTRALAGTTPDSILATMQRVADWQLAHPATTPPTGWVAAAGDAGFMALAGISGDPKYLDAMLTLATSNHWELGPRTYDADDQCVSQTYAELYLRYRDPRMIEPMRRRFDAILAQPPPVTSLDFAQGNAARDLWSWCDSLFMAPPAWVRLCAVTDDQRYLDFAVTNWWRTADYLYDRDEHLFYRDSSYFKKTEANGRKVFWSRGNGWVLAGLARMLQFMPMNHPDRPRFEKVFQEMAGKILTCQQPDGLWRASLLDPDSYPLQETSGSAFFTYALAWGINQGLLYPAKYGPAVQRGWAALATCADPDGRLTHVQPVGSDPRHFDADATAPYGVGGFLLAGSEVYRMTVLGKNADDTTAVKPALKVRKVNITNPAAFRRDEETVEVTLGNGGDASGVLVVTFGGSRNLAVMDGVSARILDSQIYSESTNGPDKLLFQVDLAPGETRSYYILDAAALASLPPPIIKTFTRVVPERHDDFAWESDRIAHRIFGKALETWQAEPLTSSGVDVWIKRTRNLVVNDMYRTMQLFNTNGVSQDDYRVGKTRGCGGLGVWQDGQLYVSKNWRTYNLIMTGPIRSEFELTYEAWTAGGRTVSETKRISIDAGSSLSRFESTFHSDDASPLKIAIGLAERPGENVIVPDGAPDIAAWTRTTAKGLVVQSQPEGWMTYWQPQDFAKGTTAVAIILPRGSIETFTNDKPNLPASAFLPPTKTFGEGQPAIRDFLAICPATPNQPIAYYLGAGWDESVDFTNAKAWNDYVRRFAERRDQPVQVTVGN
ncbi:MAG TPA: glycoside hydrolase family 88 protein [Candidatus Acidoferrum sp.]|nr:glycoside hydrolase family 88 protein [Candidatus Acidoferrum sp.]